MTQDKPLPRIDDIYAMTRISRIMAQLTDADRKDVAAWVAKKYAQPAK